MLQQGFTSVLQAGSRDDFRNEVVRFTKALGFNTVSAMAVVDRTVGRSEFVSIDNAPPGYAEAINDVPSMRRDPVMQHCRRHTVPIIWDQATYLSQGLGELWEEQARFGYRTGIAMALHLPEGRHFAMGVERDQPLPTDGGELTRLVADLQLFAVHAQDAALRVLSPAPVLVDRPSLTPRELEALRWTMEGKTAWEVGAILGISERTAVLHVTNAMHKLNCASKHQAVLKALRLGLIS
ncbi:MAG: LuxR family transcriptional regulator [Microbacteriaceae bacterium]|nr:LuxR family transcriptional regulator [Burkholderiaceae bacterium]